MDWTQIWTIVGINAALIGLLAALLIYFLNKIDGDIGGINRRLDGHATRIDQLYQLFTAQSDKFYQMFIDLLKEKK